MTKYLSPVQALWASLFITAFYPISGKMANGYVSPGILLLLCGSDTVQMYRYRSLLLPCVDDKSGWDWGLLLTYLIQC